MALGPLIPLIPERPLVPENPLRADSLSVPDMSPEKWRELKEKSALHNGQFFDFCTQPTTHVVWNTWTGVAEGHGKQSRSAPSSYGSLQIAHLAPTRQSGFS